MRILCFPFILAIAASYFKMNEMHLTNVYDTKSKISYK